MKRLKKILFLCLAVIVFASIMTVVFLVDYKIWRAEHPNAKTWTYFIRSK